MTQDQARTIFNFFLPSIEAEHKINRLLIQTVPADKLDFRPASGGKTVSELIWHMVIADHVSLTGLCDGTFPALPGNPDQTGVDAWRGTTSTSLTTIDACRS